VRSEWRPGDDKTLEVTEEKFWSTKVIEEVKVDPICYRAFHSYADQINCHAFAQHVTPHGLIDFFQGSLV
jgi:hypothetical protein